MTPFSILDLSQIGEGGSASDALANSARMAQAAEAAGYKRYWLAEHHGMPGIASAATSIVIAHVGQATKTIRIGSGGIMLPNHAPLVIAEQFGTLEALFPGRVDLGLGRAPGGDMMTARALRRASDLGADRFPDDVLELQAYLDDPKPGQPLIAMPGAGSHVPIWLLGSSLYSAQVAAAFGLPFAFASHFAPDLLMQAIDIYRRQFKPSKTLTKPHVMVGVMGAAADTDAEAAFLFSSMRLAFANLRRNVRTPFPRPSLEAAAALSADERVMVDQMLRYAMVGAPQTLKPRLERFLADTGADELIVSMPIYDIEARVKSLQLFAGVRNSLEPARALAAMA